MIIQIYKIDINENKTDLVEVNSNTIVAMGIDGDTIILTRHEKENLVILPKLKYEEHKKNWYNSIACKWETYHKTIEDILYFDDSIFKELEDEMWNHGKLYDVYKGKWSNCYPRIT